MRYWLAVLMASLGWGQTAAVRGRVVIQVTQDPIAATISVDGRMAQAGADGLYRLAVFPAGRHVMDVQSPGFKILHMEVELKAGEDLELPVAELRLASMCGDLHDEPYPRFRWMRDEAQVGVVRGAVVGLRRSALGEVGVTFTDARGEMVRKVTDGTGRFEFALKPGEYGVRLDRAGYWPVTFRTSGAAGLEMGWGDVRMSACDDGVCREPQRVELGRCE